MLASPLIGGVNFLPPRIGVSGADEDETGGVDWARTVTPTKAAASVAPTSARCIRSSREVTSSTPETTNYNYKPSHLAVPVLGLRIGRTEDLEMPFAAAPRLDHFGRDDVDENLGKDAAFGIAFEMVGRLVPAEIRIERQRQEQIVAVVEDDQLTARPLQRRMINEVLL